MTAASAVRRVFRFATPARAVGADGAPRYARNELVLGEHLPVVDPEPKIAPESLESRIPRVGRVQCNAQDRIRRVQPRECAYPGPPRRIAARALEVRDHQQCDWTELKVVEECEDPGAIGERRRRDIVQRNTERARRFGGHAIRMGQ